MSKKDVARGPDRFHAGQGRCGRLLRLAGMLLAALPLAGMLTGCGGSSNGGYSLNPPDAGFAENYGPISPGVPASFGAYLPISKVTVTLLSARLLTIPGFPAPRLIHLGVWRVTHGIMAMGQGWPEHDCGDPRTAPCAHGAVFAGFRLHPGDADEIVYFTVSAPSRSGANYYVAGLRVTYRIGPDTYTGNLYSVGEMCVLAHWRKIHSAAAACKFSNKADMEVTRMASQSG